jgi:ABC-type multidrug transport system ATPase subunit
MSDALRYNAENLIEIDSYFARAEYAYKNRCTRPILNDVGIIKINRGRHPLIDKNKVVPVSLEIGSNFNFLLITGPNTGGKTVTLKLAGLLSAMAMSGVYVPADDESKLSVFSNIYCDIGDEQSIEQSLSTFSSHVKNIINIINNVDEKSLVLLDEIGAGTDPEEGSALALAIIKKLLSKNCFGIITTHYSKLKEFAVESKKIEMLSQIYKMLVYAYGEPVQEFTYTLRDAEGKEISTETYTPKSFYEKHIGKDLKNTYVMLMNDPSRDFYKVYEIENDRHVMDGANWKYINLPIEEIKKVAIASIKDSTMMYFSCDVGKFLYSEKGLLDVNTYDYASLMGTKFGMNKKERIQTFASGSSHAMTLCAVDLDENGNPKKWLVENSWGASNGWQGHLIMTDEWFEEYMFRVVVDKKYVSADILKYLEQKPIVLPPWDPMFSEDIY